MQAGIRRLLDYGGLAKIGPHLEIERDRESPFVAPGPEYLDSSMPKLGLFIGDDSLIVGPSLLVSKIRAFDVAPSAPFN